MPLEVVVGAVIGAAATSPNVRKAVRKSLVFGVGSVLVAYDKMTAVAHGVVDGARKGAAARADSAPPETAIVAAAPSNSPPQGI